MIGLGIICRLYTAHIAAFGQDGVESIEERCYRKRLVPLFLLMLLLLGIVALPVVLCLQLRVVEVIGDKAAQGAEMGDKLFPTVRSRATVNLWPAILAT